MTDSSVPPALRAAVNERWGPGPWADCSRPGPNRVWRHPRGFVKVGTARGFAQARHAQEAWLPRLGLGHLDGVIEAERALLLRVVPGEPALATPEVFEAAGRWLRRLHALAVVDDDPAPLGQALRARHAAAVAATGIDGAFEPPAGVRVACHRDFHPRNWLWQGELGVIDFEHARLDHPLVDVVRLWPFDAGCQAAFRAGYGPLDEQGLRAMQRLHALQSLAWGRRHGDVAFVAEGERLLARLAEDRGPDGP